MQWSEAVEEHIQALKPVNKTSALLSRIISLIDLTDLNEQDHEAEIALFCEKAYTPYGDVAGVCVLPHYIRLVATQFAHSPIKSMTVANFPDGETSMESVLIEINQALEAGAEEIDVVFPYHRYLAGERQYVHSFVEACKAACGEVTLKVILETGALGDLAIIADASYDALAAGADFIKTSTGKASVGATLEAAAVMLLVIKHASTQSNRPLGCKISGGIRDIEQAAQYIELADNILGKDRVTSDTFRIGASKLVDEIIKNFERE